MKKLFSLMLLLATMITFTACGGDDKDEPNNYNSQLVGTWVAVKSTTNENLNMTVSIESVWIFKPNGSGSWTISSKLDGTPLNVREIDFSRYSYNGKELTIIADGETQSISAVLKDNTLTIVTDEGNTLTHYKQ